MQEGIAGRAEQHTRESAAAVTTDDHQLGVPRLVEQCTNRPVRHSDPVHRDIRIVFAEARETLRQQGPGDVVRGILTCDGQVDSAGVAPGVQGDRVDLAT